MKNHPLPIIILGSCSFTAPEMAAKHLYEKIPMAKQFLKKTDRTPFGVKSCFIEFSYHHRIQVQHLLPIRQFACSYINLNCSFLLQVIHSLTNSQKHSDTFDPLLLLFIMKMDNPNAKTPPRPKYTCGEHWCKNCFTAQSWGEKVLLAARVTKEYNFII